MISFALYYEEKVRMMIWLISGVIRTALWRYSAASIPFNYYISDYMHIGACLLVVATARVLYFHYGRHSDLILCLHDTLLYHSKTFI